MKQDDEKIKSELDRRFAQSGDFQQEELRDQDKEAFIMFIPSLCDMDKIKKNLIRSFYKTANIDEYQIYLRSLPDCSEFSESEQQAVDEILRAKIFIFVNRSIYLFAANKVHNNQVSESTIETTLQGPQFALTEDLHTNLNLIRHRYASPNLMIEKLSLGSSSKTELMILYDQQVVDQQILTDLRQRLAKIRVNVLISVGQLQKLLSKDERTLVPTMLITERPDRVVYNLAQGKVIVGLQGTPFTLVLPATFYDFFSAMDDMFQPFWIKLPLVIMRYVALLITVFAPAIYIAAVSYNPEIFRVQLTLSITGSRAAVPYPSFVEVLFMLFMTEALVEASIRLPKYIGATATTVGGLILGQAAQQAGLVSSIMIIVAAAVAISNFVIPINVMSLTIRTSKYVFIFLATIGGFIGIMVGFVGFIVYLTDQRSLGKPFLKLFIGERENKSGKDV